MRHLAIVALLLPVSLSFVPHGASSAVGPQVVGGFTVAPLAPLAAPTAIAFGPDGNLYATTLAGDVTEVTLAWTPAGPVPTGVSTVASGFAQPLGLAFYGGGIFVTDSGPGAESGRTDGKIVYLHDGTSTTVVDGLPNGRHNTNHLRFGPDGMLYVGNGNGNDNGVDGGAPDVKPVSGAILRVDPAAIVASPAILHWPAGVAGNDIYADPANADFRSKVSVLAHGFRNVYGVAFSPAGRAYTAMNGPDSPSSQDAVYRIEPGTDYGFPQCYNVGDPGAVAPNVRVVRNDLVPGNCTGVPSADALLGWHSCATGVDVPPAGSKFGNALYVGECSFFFPEFQSKGVTTYDTSHKVARVLLDDQGRAVEVQDFLDYTALVTDVRFGPDGALYVADAEGILRVAPLPTVTPPPATVKVVAAGFSFAPAALVVPLGTTVEFDAELFSHTLTTAPSLVDALSGHANDPANYDGDPNTFSRDLRQGSSQSVTFTHPGTYAYFCEFHYGLGMVGQITVV